MTSSAPAFAAWYAVAVFDERGRKTAESNPFQPGDPVYWTSYQHDFLDRTITTTMPDGTVNGLAEVNRDASDASDPFVYTKAYNAKGEFFERWDNQHGRHVESRDASGQLTEFDHDVEGNLLCVTIADTVQLRNQWDVMGNRVAVWHSSTGIGDPGATLSPGPGIAVSSYNGFGEVVQTINARGETTTTPRDALDRVTSVTKPEGTYTHIYRGGSPAKGAPALVFGPGGYIQVFYYGSGSTTNDYAKPTGTFKRLSTTAPSYNTSTTYNALGLVSSETDAGGLTVVHEYDTVYGSFNLRSSLAGTRSSLLSEVQSVQTVGDRVRTTELLAHDVVRVTEANASNGYLRGIESSRFGTQLQDLEYDWDEHGNLTERRDLISGKTEEFEYDALDRLTESHIAGESALSYGYDARGNLTGKAGESRTYTGYRVTSATIKGASRAYTYDSAGFVTDDGKREFEWTSFGQLERVEQQSAPALATFSATNRFAPDIPGVESWTVFEPSTAISSFEFDAGGARARQLLERHYGDGSVETRDTRYMGGYEIESHDVLPASGGPNHLKTLHRHQLGGALYTFEVPDTGTVKIGLSVVLTDHIGSTDLIVRAEWDETAAEWMVDAGDPLAELQSFDAWGERRHGESWNALRTVHTDPYRSSALDQNRGFTGHEMLDDFGLVHMNGRIYDAELGRFLSPDPYVQVPEFSQNFNRYSYVLNNPLSHTDPSGHFIEIVGFVSAVISAGVLSPVGEKASAAWQGGNVATATKLTVKHVAGHAVLGGVSQEAMGGRFQDGFLSGAVSTLAMDLGISQRLGLGTPGDWSNPAKALGRTAVAGIIGGTASEIGGGKFANGALTAAWGHLFNAETKKNWRHLTPGEMKLAKEVFGEQIDYSTVHVFRKKYMPAQGKNVTMAPNGNIYVPPGSRQDVPDFSKASVGLMHHFIHEMTHVWQHSKGKNVVAGAVSALGRYKYLPLKKGKAFEKYNIEQQADMIADYWAQKRYSLYFQKGSPRPTNREYEKLVPIKIR